MKVVEYTRYGPPELLEVVERAMPVPKDKELVIRVHATVATAVDAIFRSGRNLFARMATGMFKPKHRTLGSSFAGVVEAVGKDVTRFKVGDRLFGDSKTGTGCWGEYVCQPEEGPFIGMPDTLSFEEGASVPYGALTALPFIRDEAKTREGQSILIIGAAGSVGSSAVQFASRFGAEVTGVCSEANAALVRSLGANRIIDYRRDNFTRSGEKYDVIFDSVGKSSFSECYNSLTENGMYLTTVISSMIMFQMLASSRFSSRKAKIAFTGLRPVEQKQNDMKVILGMLERGEYKPTIDRTYSLDEIVEANRYVDGGHKGGNVLIRVRRDNSV